MIDPYISYDGTVYSKSDIMHPNSRACSHEGPHSCPMCDFDRYYARKHGTACPWFGEGDE